MASNTGNMGDGDNPSSSKVDGDHIEGSIASENNRNNDSLHVSNKHNFFLSLLGLKYESQPEKPTGQEGAANKKADEGFAVPQIDPESDEAVSKLDNGTLPQGSVSFEVLLKKAVSLLKEKTDRDEQVANLRDQISTLWGKIESLQQQNRAIREKSVRMHAKAEQEEEYISNMLLKRIQKIKNEKETLALKYEQEEECLTNDLTKKMNQLKKERDELAQKVETEQWVIEPLKAKIKKLETEVSTVRATLCQLRQEKVDLENALEHEQESLFNSLGKRVDKLEKEKRHMQALLDHQSVGSELHSSTSPRSDPSRVSEGASSGGSAGNDETTISGLRNEIQKLREEKEVLRKSNLYLRKTVKDLHARISIAEGKYMPQIVEMLKNASMMRDGNRSARAALQDNLTRCLDTCRDICQSLAHGELQEEPWMKEILQTYGNVSSSPLSPNESGGGTFASSSSSSSFKTNIPIPACQPPSPHSQTNIERMEEGSENNESDTVFYAQDGKHDSKSEVAEPSRVMTDSGNATVESDCMEEGSEMNDTEGREIELIDLSRDSL